MATVDPWKQALIDEGVVGTPLEKIAMLTRGFESGGNPDAVSNRGARGWMQVMPATFQGVADTGWDINNPYHNARAGIRYLKQGWEASGGDPALTGAYYYGGPGGMAKAKQGVAVSDPVNPQAPNTIQYGQRLASAANGAPAMSTNFPISLGVPTDFDAIYSELAKHLPKPEVDPALVQGITKKRQTNISMLPLAIGAMLSGDKGISRVGSELFQRGESARDMVPLGDEGFIDPETGQFLNNPTGDEKRRMSLLPLTIASQDRRINAQSSLYQALSSQDLTNQFRQLELMFKADNNAMAHRKEARETESFDNDPTRMATRAVTGSGAPQPQSMLPLATGAGAPPAPPVPNQGTGQITSNATVPTSPQPTANKPQVSVPVGPANGSPVYFDAQTGNPVYSFNGHLWQNDGEKLVKLNNTSSLIHADTWEKNVNNTQGQAAKLARIKGILEQVHSNPEAFGDFMSFVSGVTPAWLSDRVAAAKLTPEQFNLRNKVLKDAAEAIHELYGAAVTGGEKARAEQIFVNPTSPNEKIIAALAKTPDFLEYLKSSVSPAAFDAALKRGGMSPDQLVFPSHNAAAGKKDNAGGYQISDPAVLEFMKQMSGGQK